MDLETIQEMKKELELALINLNEGASDEKYSGLLGVAKTPKMLAYILDTKKIYGEVMFTSSMDFASEYGFADNGDARKLFDDAVKMRDVCLSSAHHQSKFFNDTV